MHVIVVAIGSRGDIFPFIGLGRALQALGCSVHFITSGNYQTAVTKAGLRYIELCDTATYEAVRDLLEHMPARSSEMTPMQWEAARAFLSMTPEGVYRLIEANHVPGKTILAASDMYLNGAGRLAWEKLGIPYVAVRHNAGVMHSLLPRLPRAGHAVEMWFRNLALGRHWPMRENKLRYQHLRAELGLKPHRNLLEAYWHSEQLSVALFPAWFAPWFCGQLPNTIFTNFPLYETADAEGLPEKLDSFLSRGAPPLVFTYASWLTNVEGYFGASGDACRTMGLRGVFLSEYAPASDEDGDSATISLPYASLKLLLPRAKALIHHGGIGTVARALAQGTPQLIVPCVGDQPFNGKTVQSLGVGLSISHDLYQRDPVCALKSLLESRAVGETCRKLSQQMPGEPDFREVVQRFEGLLKDSEL
ncbi:MAG TPA: nucleotide disphospho-sugar-binding domain-containing protein [Pyrinomonadaceae bacterium]